MIEEVPCGVFIKTQNDSNKNISDSIEINTLPLSIEIIPHKAILIQEAEVIIVSRNYRCNYHYSKWCFFIFCGIPFMFGILLVVGILNPEALHL
uniref:Uncharacterized protein n=1 Tax=viral metagenome TaxID=1070528 RepID=A0A6C0D0L2_9ZZZZ